MPPLEIVVDGTDSGGKTPCVAALRDSFAAERDVRTCAPFRVQEVYPLWQREPRRAAATIRAVMDDFRRASGAADMIIWDRGWPTVFVSTNDVVARGALLPFPDLTVLLLNTAETTLAKARKHGLDAVWATDPALVRRYHDAYHALPREVSHARLSVFLPNPDGRYDYAAIGAAVRARLRLP
jgi:hypothetical protein